MLAGTDISAQVLALLPETYWLNVVVLISGLIIGLKDYIIWKKDSTKDLSWSNINFFGKTILILAFVSFLASLTLSFVQHKKAIEAEETAEEDKQSVLRQFEELHARSSEQQEKLQNMSALLESSETKLEEFKEANSILVEIMRETKKLVSSLPQKFSDSSKNNATNSTVPESIVKILEFSSLNVIGNCETNGKTAPGEFFWSIWVNGELILQRDVTDPEPLSAGESYQFSGATKVVATSQYTNPIIRLSGHVRELDGKTAILRRWSVFELEGLPPRLELGKPGNYSIKLGKTTNCSVELEYSIVDA